jgi:hypothetical protein
MIVPFARVLTASRCSNQYRPLVETRILARIFVCYGVAKVPTRFRSWHWPYRQVR